MSRSLDKISEFYQLSLYTSPVGSKALNYLYARGFTDETIKEFRVGFSPEQSIDYRSLDILKYSDLSSLEDLQHLFPSKGGTYIDRFKGRITFPLINTSGATLGFAARDINGSLPKYLNSAESSVYHKAKCLFGLQLAAPFIYDADYAILCEGYTDAMAFHQVGKRMAVAAGGTYATKHQLALIGRYTNNIFLAFDADEAGDGVTGRTTQAAKEMGFNVAYITMGRGEDPAERLLGKPTII